ncbi:hypothetical protein DFJ73DRAFT_902219 [Zopfochytrium polystomum]|nr:hypothetical protein DFJ73DRAFT_902219 [Zopfochytrium polystomum]
MTRTPTQSCESQLTPAAAESTMTKATDACAKMADSHSATDAALAALTAALSVDASSSDQPPTSSTGQGLASTFGPPSPPAADDENGVDGALGATSSSAASTTVVASVLLAAGPVVVGLVSSSHQLVRALARPGPDPQPRRAAVHQAANAPHLRLAFAGNRRPDRVIRLETTARVGEDQDTRFARSALGYKTLYKSSYYGLETDDGRLLAVPRRQRVGADASPSSRLILAAANARLTTAVTLWKNHLHLWSPPPYRCVAPSPPAAAATASPPSPEAVDSVTSSAGQSRCSSYESFSDTGSVVTFGFLSPVWGPFFLSAVIFLAIISSRDSLSARTAGLPPAAVGPISFTGLSSWIVSSALTAVVSESGSGAEEVDSTARSTPLPMPSESAVDSSSSPVSEASRDGAEFLSDSELVSDSSSLPFDSLSGSADCDPGKALMDREPAVGLSS